MFTMKSAKKLAGAIAIFTIGGLIAGCDDDHHNHPHPRPPHEDRHGSRHRDDHRHRPHDRRRYASLIGTYSARALNDVVATKGTTISLQVIQGNDETLRLVDPTGKQYRIGFDAETNTGYIAGGSLSLREDGLFVYTDAKGGVWLVEKQ